MRKKTIVIDDDLACRKILSHYLESKGYDVVTYESANFCELCCHSLSSCCLDGDEDSFILTDNQMPGLNGLEMIARQEQSGCKVPVERKAVLSGSLTPEELAQARQLGCKIFFKPYNLNEIADWLEQRERIFYDLNKASGNVGCRHTGCDGN